MRRHVLAALCSGVVAACGGGGGDGPAPVQPTVAVTAGNQEQVGRAAASSVVSIASVGAGVTASSGGAGIAALPGAARQAALALRSTRKAVLSAGTAPQALQPVDSMVCAAGGSATVTLDDTNNNLNADIGEALIFSFVHCRSTATDEVDGTISVTLASVAQTTAGINFTGTMSFDIRGTEGTRSATISGSVSAAYTDVSTTVARTDLTVGASGLTGAVSSGGVVETLTYENAFSISTTETADQLGNPVSTSTVVSGGLTSSVLAGRIIIATQQPVVQLAADLYPSSGVLRATGTSGSALRMTVIDAVGVQLDLDADGNSTYEATRPVAWATLLPS